MLSKRAKIAYDKGYRIKNGQVISPRGNIRKTHITGHYPQFCIRHEGKSVQVRAHQLAAYQKFGMDVAGEDIEVRHVDDKPANFKLNNIELGNRFTQWVDRKRNKKNQQKGDPQHEH